MSCIKWCYLQLHLKTVSHLENYALNEILELKSYVFIENEMGGNINAMVKIN